MFILADSNPVKRIGAGHVNRALIGICVVVFLAQLGDAVPLESYALVPAQLTAPDLVAGGFAGPPWWVRIFTHIFMHGSWLHLGANMLALWVFGDNVEDSMGHGRFLGFFLVCGIAGGLAEAVFTTHPMVPVVGASGAISGVMGAYLLLHPRAKILVLLLNRIPLLVPAAVVVGLEVAANVVMALAAADPSTTDPEGELIAWWAHVGGFAAGAALILVLRHRDVPLFQPASVYPEVDFPRIQRFLIDLAPRTAGGWSDRLVAVAKVLMFLFLLGLLGSAL